MKTGGRLALAVVFSMIIGLTGFSGAECAESGKTLVGTVASDFNCASVGTPEFRLGEVLKSRPAVLMAFWGLRCGECIDEIPALNRIHETYGRKGLQVVGVNIDGVAPDLLKEMMTTMGLDIRYRVLADTDFGVMGKFSVEAAPTTILIGKDMKIRYVHLGYKAGDEKELESAIVEQVGR